MLAGAKAIVSVTGAVNAGPVTKLSLADRSGWKCSGAVAAFHLGFPSDELILSSTRRSTSGRPARCRLYFAGISKPSLYARFSFVTGPANAWRLRESYRNKQYRED
jgi:hypothetical protein